MNASAGITAAVIALNEAANISGCLETLGWAGEMLVMDGGSTDDTVARAQACGARVLQRPFDTFARQRNHALDDIFQLAHSARPFECHESFKDLRQ